MMKIKAAMQAQGITQAELARRAGLSRSVVSQYFSGITQPSEKALEKLRNALNIESAPECKKLSVKRAAALIGVDAQTLRVALQKNIVPFGTAWKNGKRYTYVIYPQKFEEYTGVKIGGTA